MVIDYMASCFKRFYVFIYLFAPLPSRVARALLPELASARLKNANNISNNNKIIITPVVQATSCISTALHILDNT